MPPEAEYVIDRDAVEAEVARTRARLAKGKLRYFARQSVAAAIAFFVMFYITRIELFSRLGELPAWKIGVVFGFPILAGILVAAFSMRETFKDENLDTERRMQRIGRELQSLGGPGWILRSILTGIKLGLAIGLTVGVIMLLTWSTSRLGSPNRWAFFSAFVGVTLLWTIPAAFILRWIQLLALKRMVKQA